MKIPRFSRVLRTVAIFEATKGVLVLVVGGGLLSVMPHNLENVAETIMAHFHLNPANRYPHIFLKLAAQLTDSRLWLLAMFAVAYAILRFVEAYGLWRARSWAEWLAALSGGIYIPFELLGLISHPGWWTAGTLAVNVAVVLFMAYGLRHSAEVTAEVTHTHH